MTEIGTTAHLGKLVAERKIALGGRESEPFLVGAVKAAVFVLMYHPAPVGEVESRFPEMSQIVEGYGKGCHRLNGLHVFLAQRAV